MSRIKEDCKEVKYLKGPVTLSILENKDSKIVLLGDMHIYEPKCSEDTECEMELPLYLEQLFMTYNGIALPIEPINFFVELDFDQSIRTQRLDLEGVDISKIKHSKKIINDYLETTWIYFSDCLQTLKTKCKFNNIKFHYSDTRRGIIHSETEDKEKIVLEDINKFFIKTSKITFKDIIKLYRGLIYLMTQFIDKNVEFFFNYSKINKQLKNVDKKIVEKLQDYLLKDMKTKQNFMEEWKYYFLDQLNELERLHSITAKDWEDIGVGLDDMMVSFSSLFDIYTIARMIKHNMKNVIIYAGDWHVTNIKKFLIDELGYNEVVHKTSNQRGKHFQCINMKDVPQPWFGKVEKSGKKYYKKNINYI